MVGIDNPKSKKSRTILIIVGIVIAAAILGVGVRGLQQYAANREESKKQALNDKVSDIQNVALAGDPDKALSTIDKELGKSNITSEEKYALYFQQGLTYENEQKYDQAIDSYKQSAEISDTQAAAEAIARTAQTKGDKEMAITYYKKALSKIPDDYPLAQTDKKIYEQTIKDLGGQP